MKATAFFILMLISFILGYQYALYKYAPQVRQSANQEPDINLHKPLADLAVITKDIADKNFAHAEDAYTEAKKNLDGLLSNTDGKKKEILEQMKEKLESIRNDLHLLKKES